MTQDITPIKVEVISDFICPWCFIAERRLKQAAKDAGLSVALSYRPFELNPEMPTEGISRKTYRSRKFGTWERSLQLDQHTQQASKDDPLTINYDKMLVTPNSRKAHRLVLYFKNNKSDKEEAVSDAIFEAYFTHGKDIGKTEILSQLASQFGFEQDEITSYLDSHIGVDIIIQEETEIVQTGVQGVPEFRIGQLRMSGSQPKSIMISFLEQAKSEQ